MNRGIRAAYDRVYEAEAKRDALIARTYPIGDMIVYEHGDNCVSVEVIGHSGDRLKVRSSSSGKEYWIGAYRVV